MDDIGITYKNYKIIFDSISNNDTIATYSFNNNSKMKYKIYLDFFMEKRNLKELFIITPDCKKIPEEEEAIEKFKAKRSEVNLKI